MIIRIVKLLLKPWVIATSSSLTAAYLVKNERRKSSRIREAKLELIEQQRTIDRLRAELGKERFQRQEAEKAAETKQDNKKVVEDTEKPPTE